MKVLLVCTCIVKKHLNELYLIHYLLLAKHPFYSSKVKKNPSEVISFSDVNGMYKNVHGANCSRSWQYGSHYCSSCQTPTRNKIHFPMMFFISFLSSSSFSLKNWQQHSTANVGKQQQQGEGQHCPALSYTDCCSDRNMWSQREWNWWILKHIYLRSGTLKAAAISLLLFYGATECPPLGS